jgi:hypothetical protein
MEMVDHGSRLWQPLLKIRVVPANAGSHHHRRLLLRKERCQFTETREQGVRVPEPCQRGRQ